ncbi:hypothetical protein LSAT2_006040, partial [Lamellibrachia satsuma]
MPILGRHVKRDYLTSYKFIENSADISHLTVARSRPRCAFKCRRRHLRKYQSRGTRVLKYGGSGPQLRGTRVLKYGGLGSSSTEDSGPQVRGTRVLKYSG